MIKIYVILTIMCVFINPKINVEYPCIVGNIRIIHKVEEKLKGRRIIIPKIDKNLEIKDGTDTITLKKNIGSLTHFDYNHKILAGHNYKNLFGHIYKLEKNDIIIIVNNGEEKFFYVKEKHIIKEDDMSYFKETTYPKITLITCTLNDDERLLIIATSDF